MAKAYHAFSINSNEVLTVSTGGAVASAAAPVANIYRLSGDVAFYFLIGANPTALTSNGIVVGAGAEVFVSVPAGHKVSVLGGASGVVSVTSVELT